MYAQYAKSKSQVPAANVPHGQIVFHRLFRPYLLFFHFHATIILTLEVELCFMKGSVMLSGTSAWRICGIFCD